MTLQKDFPTLYDYVEYLNTTREKMEESVTSTIKLVYHYYGQVWTSDFEDTNIETIIKESKEAFPNWVFDTDVKFNRKVPRRGDIVILFNSDTTHFSLIIADSSDEVNDIYSGFEVRKFLGEEYKVDYVKYNLRSVYTQPVCFIRNFWPIVVEKPDVLSEDCIVLVNPGTLAVIQEFAELTDSILNLHKVIVSRMVPVGKVLYADRNKLEEVMMKLTAPKLTIEPIPDGEPSVGLVVDLDNLFEEVDYE